MHLLIHFGYEKLEKWYMRNNDSLSKAFNEKDFNKFDRKMAEKIAMDAHLFAKPILAQYRSLFTFTNALLITVGEEAKL